MGTHLLIVDPQNSFCDPSGELYVPGAEKDMIRLAELILRRQADIDRISVTLDSHNKIHIAHPIWWRNAEGDSPSPFTLMTFEDVKTGRWQAADPDTTAWSRRYMEKVGSQVIWPYHCMIGTWGHQVYGPLHDRLRAWEEIRHHLLYVVKGGCPYTEHFSAVRPSMEVPGDPSTMLNRALIESLEASVSIWVAGQAASHCVADTITDILEFSEDRTLADRMTLITDAMSAVSGFEEQARTFFERATAAGATLREAADL